MSPIFTVTFSYCSLELNHLHLEWNWWLSAPISTELIIPPRILAFLHLHLKWFTLLWFCFNLKVVFWLGVDVQDDRECKLRRADHMSFPTFNSNRSQRKQKEKTMCVFSISCKPKILVEAGVGNMWLYGQRTLFISVVLSVGLSIIASGCWREMPVLGSVLRPTEPAAQGWGLEICM